jgi:multiple sugar transport system permease protein
MSDYTVSQAKSSVLVRSLAHKRVRKPSETYVYRVLRVVGLVFVSLITLFPLYTIVTTAIKPLQDVQSTFHWIPSQITFAPFGDIWQTVPLARYERA